MSTSDEIYEDYLTDIAEKSNQVIAREGIIPFLTGDGGGLRWDKDINAGISVFTLLDPETQAELSAIADATREADLRIEQKNREIRIRNNQINFLYKIGVCEPGVKYEFHDIWRDK